MAIIRWLNRHVFASIIIYFALMAGVGWAVNQSIADRTALEAMPADGDLIAIYDLDATAGKSIAVSTFRGDNLNAIVNAETGVVTPQITMYDSSAAAGTAAIYGTSTGSYDVVMSLGVEDSGSATGTAYIELDGVNETVDVLKPLTAPSVDAGSEFDAVNTASVDWETAFSSVCNYTFIVGDAAQNTTRYMPDTILCGGVATRGKTFRILNNADTEALLLEPGEAGVDTFQIKGPTPADDCDAGDYVSIPAKGAVDVFGRTADIWFVFPIGDTTPTCEPD